MKYFGNWGKARLYRQWVERAGLPPEATKFRDKPGQKDVAWMIPGEGSHQRQRRQMVRAGVNIPVGKIIMGLLASMVILLGLGLYQANQPSAVILTTKGSQTLPPSSEVVAETIEVTTSERSVATIALQRPKEEGLPQICYEIIALDSNGQRLDIREIHGKMEILVTGYMSPYHVIKTLCYNASSNDQDIPVGVPQVVPLEEWWLRGVDQDTIMLTVTIHREGNSDLESTMPVELD